MGLSRYYYGNNSGDIKNFKKIEKVLWILSSPEMAAIAMTALDESSKPRCLKLHHIPTESKILEQCFEATVNMSSQGKLALVRALAEDLAVNEKITHLTPAARSSMQFNFFPTSRRELPYV